MLNFKSGTPKNHKSIKKVKKILWKIFKTSNILKNLNILIKFFEIILSQHSQRTMELNKNDKGFRKIENC